MCLGSGSARARRAATVGPRRYSDPGAPLCPVLQSAASDRVALRLRRRPSLQREGSGGHLRKIYELGKGHGVGGTFPALPVLRQWGLAARLRCGDTGVIRRYFVLIELWGMPRHRLSADLAERRCPLWKRDLNYLPSLRSGGA